MLYPYMTLNDKTEITHSEIIHKRGQDMVKVYMEKPLKNDFATATCWLPNYEWKHIKGFTKKELLHLDDIIHSGAHLFFDFARKGGFGAEDI